MLQLSLGSGFLPLVPAVRSLLGLGNERFFDPFGFALIFGTFRPMRRKHVHFDAKGHLVSADGANHESRFSKGKNPEVITGTGLHAVRAKLANGNSRQSEFVIDSCIGLPTGCNHVSTTMRLSSTRLPHAAQGMKPRTNSR